MLASALDSLPAMLAPRLGIPRAPSLGALGLARYAALADTAMGCVPERSTGFVGVVSTINGARRTRGQGGSQPIENTQDDWPMPGSGSSCTQFS